MALKITSGKLTRAQRIVLYGSEGIGKTTLTSRMPDPLIIDLEDGSTHIDVRRIGNPGDWDSLLDVLEEILCSPGLCKTVVIDTADRAETMCVESLCKKFKKAGLEDFGYGKGYQYLSEEFQKLLDACDKLIAAGINVVIVAHAKMRKMELPDEQGAFDRWELKLTRQVAPLVKEWPDALLFLNYKTMVIQGKSEMEKAKAHGGKRVIYTTHSPVWDAKNRHDLPEEMVLSYENIARIFETPPAEQPVKAPPMEVLRKLMDESAVTEEELRKVVASRGQFPMETAVKDYPDEFISAWILPNWKQILLTVNEDPEHVPF